MEKLHHQSKPNSLSLKMATRTYKTSKRTREKKLVKASERRVRFSFETGPQLWKDLHTQTGITPDWLRSFSKRVKKLSACGCLNHWLEWLHDNPLPETDQFEWTVRAHNAVNKRLGKSELSLSEARTIWSSPG